jgi:hypothetical protein
MAPFRTPTLLLIAAGIAAADPVAAALDQAVAELPATPAAAAASGHQHTTPVLRLVDVSLAVVAAAGGSTATDHEHEGLAIGGHDPSGRGFTLQGAELSLTGAVDPYFTAEAHLTAAPEHGIELEEAFITTTGLPHALEVKAGYQLIEFGRANTLHMHASGWINQPVIAGRLLGGEGSRSTGARVAWLAPAPWYSQFSVGGYNGDDASLASFRGEAAGSHEHDHVDEPERTIAGRLRAEELTTGSWADMLWSARWENAADLAGVEAKLGLSWLGGANATGEGTRSDIYGADLVLAATPTGGTVTSLKLTAEAMLRRAEVAESADEDEDGNPFTAPQDELTDWGLYAQLVVGLGSRWSVGLRGEYADASGASVGHDGLMDSDADAVRDRRIRISPLASWRPSEFSRLRLQYDYDRAQHLVEGPAHSVWLGLDVLIGAHPAHGF